MYFQWEGQEKILLCKKGGHYMKNKNIGAAFCQLNLISEKAHIEKNFIACFAHLVFYKIHISGAANCHAPVQYAKYVFFFFFFLFSWQSS